MIDVANWASNRTSYSPVMLVWKTVGTDLMSETFLGRLLSTVALLW